MNQDSQLDDDNMRLRHQSSAPNQTSSATHRNESLEFARRALIAACIGLFVVAMGLLMWYAINVLLLVFAGVLFGILLRGFSRAISKRVRINHGWALTIVLLGLLAIVVLTGWFLAGRIAAQTDTLTEAMPRAINQLRVQLQSYGWGERLLNQLPAGDEWSEFLSARRASLVGRVSGIFSGVLGGVVNLFIIIAIGCYVAAEPRLYKLGIIHLVPPAYRRRAREVLDELDTALGRWLIGRVALMFLNGGMTTLGLWLLDVPLALTLGIFAGVLNFVPNFGPLIAGVPAVLIALLVNPQTALYTALLYFVIQMLDGYVFTPLVDKRSVELPPVLTITAQVLLGVTVGGIGLVLASPLVASLLVMVRMLYVEDTLGDQLESKSSQEKS